MRKEIIITIPDQNRDHGKSFQIYEMPAHKAEKWAIKAFLALASSGIDIPDDVAEQGLAGVASLGMKALTKLSFESAEPLLDEMFECIKFIPEPSRPEIVRGLIPDDIEEVSTRLMLRKKVLDLHMDFFTAVAR